MLEHLCFCALDGALRPACLSRMKRQLLPGGWLLGLFCCHSRPGGPPWDSDAGALLVQRGAAGFRCELWQPASGSLPCRIDAWLGLWRREP